MTKRQRQIAAKIADACLRAVNQGWKIRPEDGNADCMCPLGALSGDKPPRVGPRVRYPGFSQLGMKASETAMFIRGFDDGAGLQRSWAAKLGRKYRQWSKAKYGWTEE